MDTTERKIKLLSLFLNPYARQLTIIVTRNCNENCINCPVEKSRGELKEELIPYVIRFVDKYNIQQIKLFGGEPLLYRDIIVKLVKALRVKDHRRYIELGTALGRGVGEIEGRFWKFLRKNKVIIFLNQIALKNKDELKKLQALYSHGYIVLNVLVTPNYFEALYESIEEALRFNIKRVNILPDYFYPWNESDIEVFNSFLFSLKDRFKDVSFENITRHSYLPLFNLGFTIDIDGGLYWTNIPLAKYKGEIVKELFIGDIKRVLSENRESFNLPSLSFIHSLYFRLVGIKAKEKIDLIGEKLSRFIDIVIKERVNSILKPLPSKKIKKLELHISYSCINKCIFCSEKHRLDTNLYYTPNPKEIIYILEHYISQGVNQITFTGGEPLLYPFIVDITGYAKKLGYHVLVITNGIVLKDIRLCNELLKYVDEILFSFHSIKINEWEILTGHTFLEDVIEVINYLTLNASLRRKVKIGANIVVTQYNKVTVYETLEFLLNKKFDWVIISNPSPEGAALKNYEKLVVSNIGFWEKLSEKIYKEKIYNKIEVRFFGVPFCWLYSKANFLSNDLYWQPKVVVEYIRKKDNTVYPHISYELKNTRKRTKLRDCGKCKWLGICGGIFKKKKHSRQ